LDGITFSGGDPIEQYDKFVKIANVAKKNKLNI
jgi:pyruvate-formate lyase-activating enzyme